MFSLYFTLSGATGLNINLPLSVFPSQFTAVQSIYNIEHVFKYKILLTLFKVKLWCNNLVLISLSS